MIRISDRYALMQASRSVRLFDEWVGTVIKEFRVDEASESLEFVQSIKYLEGIEEEDKTMIIFWAGYYYGRRDVDL